jgi:hypothetical protein
MRSSGGAGRQTRRQAGPSDSELRNVAPPKRSEAEAHKKQNPMYKHEVLILL